MPLRTPARAQPGLRPGFGRAGEDEKILHDVGPEGRGSEFKLDEALPPAPLRLRMDLCPAEI